MKHRLYHYALLLLLWTPSAWAVPESITLFSSDSPAHTRFSNLLQQRLTSENINPLSSTKKLRITIGPEMLEQALSTEHTTPLLALLITQHEFTTLTRNRPLPALISAIYREQPIQRLVNLTKIATPSIQQVALFIPNEFNRSIPDASILAPHRTDHLYSAIKSTLSTVDAIITHHSPLLYNARSFKHLLLSSYRQQKPLICHTQAMVTAGCIMGSYSNAEQLIEESIDWIGEYQQGESIQTLTPPRYSSYFTVATNNQVARSLGYHLPHASLLTQQLHILEEDGL